MSIGRKARCKAVVLGLRIRLKDLSGQGADRVGDMDAGQMSVVSINDFKRFMELFQCFGQHASRFPEQTTAIYAADIEPFRQICSKLELYRTD